MSEICQTLNVQDEELKNKVSAILDDNKKLKKQNSDLLKEIHYFKILKNIEDKNMISKFNFQVFYQDYVEGKILKNILEEIKSTQERLILIILQKNNKKIEIYALVTKDCFDVISAKDIISTLNESIGSSGGGRNEFAQAGIDFDGNVDELQNKVSQNISKIIHTKEN